MPEGHAAGRCGPLRLGAPGCQESSAPCVGEEGQAALLLERPALASPHCRHRVCQEETGNAALGSKGALKRIKGWIEMDTKWFLLQRQPVGPRRREGHPDSVTASWAQGDKGPGQGECGPGNMTSAWEDRGSEEKEGGGQGAGRRAQSGD